MQTINRCVIVMLPRQPMLDWLLRLDPDSPPMTLDELREDTTAFLAPEFDDIEQTMEWLAENFRVIFEEVLYGWYTDKSVWPSGGRPYGGDAGSH